ncbi:predicted protein [Clavispora lusitaniae ATCC 42720]|uniref:Transmembrane protein n=1 Tax=Clavispora lusitaniae (strain ATCC 42720) TaxID=306902 RepID=C4YA08_CLAL4|nr:uncharacterized protein CLUG_04946 [Clavispora lusitaniae ATCC 42720]EEQ40818.1 predicted protein [Clavispora lusitaniae ATCC 42720]
MGYHARATQRSGRNRLGPRREFRNGAVSRQSAEKLGAVTDGRFSCCRLICSAFPFSSSICAAFLFSHFHLSSGATPSIRGRGSAPRMAALFFYLFFFLSEIIFPRTTVVLPQSALFIKAPVPCSPPAPGAAPRRMRRTMAGTAALICRTHIVLCRFYMSACVD